ncbi:cyclopropane-fatty-acyl-phospholipid synthase family protein [Streptomyces sp. ODS05-4]|uniref:class I SAM-dependent methyltransferase n=1 Tax=Streptomyces sp. ODS05-4 TaxID=2944939 RepID=UPI00210BF66D|nr:cyclopropane-fatty-acyl-phospholipid synthase family protein [Streptomyces sp. ODS05-4]
MTLSPTRSTDQPGAEGAAPGPDLLPAARHPYPATRVSTDPVRWPDVARLPAPAPVRTAIARTLLRRAFRRLPLAIRLGDAPAEGAGPGLTVHDPDAFFRRVGTSGLIGFGESYMAGEWDSDDLAGVLTVLAARVDDLVPAPLRTLRGAWVRRRPAADRNSLTGARKNIHRHYDLSNELFEEFLDPTMTYSSAVFGSLPARPEELSAAQARKIDRLLDLAGVGEGTRLLEIGTGWGELALRAAARGAHVITITLSTEQRDLALRRIADAGHADRVDVRLCDYREVEGAYDAVVSVEMIEAVGAEFWPAYFATLRDRLAPGGKVALQAITMPHERMLNTSRTHTWISKYVFPGGLIPSREAVVREAARAGLKVTADHGYGEHYAETLRLWRERFAERAAEVRQLGFDTVFQRMWELYLAYSEAGFRARYLDVRQIRLAAATVPAQAAPRDDAAAEPAGRPGAPSVTAPATGGDLPSTTLPAQQGAR